MWFFGFSEVSHRNLAKNDSFIIQNLSDKVLFSTIFIDLIVLFLLQSMVTDLRTVSFDVPPQEILTKDSVTVAVDAVVL